jgi:hypothetical protein
MTKARFIGIQPVSIPDLYTNTNPSILWQTLLFYYVTLEIISVQSLMYSDPKKRDWYVV